MKKIVILLGEVLSEILQNIGYGIKNNLYNFSLVLNFITPYLCLWLGSDIYKTRGYFAVGGEWFVPVMMFLVVVFLQKTANKLGKGISIPRHRKRFTEVSDEGEVLVSNARLEEMLLYIADLEDWMEKEGIALWQK